MYFRLTVPIQGIRQTKEWFSEVCSETKGKERGGSRRNLVEECRGQK
jgi:hypothetical protein